MLGEKRSRHEDTTSRLSRHIPNKINFDMCRVPNSASDFDRGYDAFLARNCQIQSQGILSFGVGGHQPINAKVPTSQTKPVLTKGFKVLDAPGLTQQPGANIISWSANGLLIGLSDAIYKYDLTSGETVRVLYGNTVKQLSWAGTTRFVSIIAQNSTDGLVLADVNQGHLRSISLAGSSSTMCMVEKVLVVGYDDLKKVGFHDLRVKESLVTTQILGKRPTAVTMNGFMAAAGDESGCVSIFDLRSLNEKAHEKVSDQSISALASLSSSELVAGSGSSLSLLRFVPRVSGDNQIEISYRSITQSPVTCIHMTSANHLIAGHREGSVTVRDAQTLVVKNFAGELSDSVSSGVICLGQDAESGVIAAAHQNETIRFYRPTIRSKDINLKDLDIVDSLR